jgi:nicotinamide-nucleotide amidase
VTRSGEVITIGDELLIGQVINTNQAYIAEQLNLVGIHIEKMTTVGDELNSIVAAFADAWRPGRLIVATGGLGPTHDDITKTAACKFFSCGLRPDPTVRAHVESLLARRNLPWSEAAETQVMVPDGATVVHNAFGTAPGLHFAREDRDLYILPGVPYEMKEILDREIVPALQQRVNEGVIRHRTLRTTGISESLLAHHLGDIGELVGSASLAFLPSPTGVRLRITVRDADAARADRRVADVEERIRAKAAKYIYGAENEEIEEVLGRLLTERNKTLAVAESCTGGLIAHRITNVSGSSAYFERGLVTYSNPSKISLLRVPHALIEHHGAVSREVAEAMAHGVRELAGTDIGVSTTGIAGPTGGSPDKPVGLVWIGYSDARATFALKFQFGDDRVRFKERASQAALELVRRKLLTIE